MKTGWLVAVLLGATLSFSVAQTGDKRAATGRACISVINTLNSDEEALRGDATGRRGLKIAAHLDATVPCDALAAVFTKTGQALPGCRPQFVALSARNEMPAKGAGNGLGKGTQTDPGYVVFFAKGSKESAEPDAVAAMQGATDANIVKPSVEATS